MDRQINTYDDKQGWDGVERRKNPDSCRRKIPDRRSNRDRRHDPRAGKASPKRTLIAWFRSLMYTRTGVDRRKGVDRRVCDRRSSPPSSLLSQEEISELSK